MNIVLYLLILFKVCTQEIYVEIGPGKTELSPYIKTFSVGDSALYLVNVITPDGLYSIDTVDHWPELTPYEVDGLDEDMISPGDSVNEDVGRYINDGGLTGRFKLRYKYCLRYTTIDGYYVLITPTSYYKQKWVEY